MQGTRYDRTQMFCTSYFVLRLVLLSNSFLPLIQTLLPWNFPSKYHPGESLKKFSAEVSMGSLLSISFSIYQDEKQSGSSLINYPRKNEESSYDRSGKS